MRKRSLILAFFILRLIFAAGYVWAVHTEGPVLASVTLKLKHRHLAALHEVDTTVHIDATPV